MATETTIDEAAYRDLALAETDRKWELRDGHLREKPPMTAAHNWIASKIGHQLMLGLDWSAYQVRFDAGRVHRPVGTFIIPDVFVVPSALVRPLYGQSDVLESYDQPLPLVVEVWSRSTGAYDVTEKLAVYRQHGDLEIWLVHPYERTLTSWCRQPDGAYESIVVREGIVRPLAFPEITIDLDQLFELD
jgi:Uma2 family endonuclease